MPECGAGRAGAAWHQPAPKLSLTTDKDSQEVWEHAVLWKSAQKMLWMSLQVTFLQSAISLPIALGSYYSPC